MDNKLRKTKIESIDYADPDISTDVVDLVHLSDGVTLHIDAGKPTHNIYDQAIGDVEVGAELVETIIEGDGGEYRTHLFKTKEVSYIYLPVEP